ncbi:MAG: cysteine desulfurase family protein [Nanoarchaeota archaeon]|mgnify:CR=1 FL=1
MKVYLDNAASTPIDPDVITSMIPCYSTCFGNPSSTHQFGLEAAKQLSWARNILAQSLNASPHEIIFTSGGTESNNLALNIAFTKPRPHIIITTTEHSSILAPAKNMLNNNCEVTILSVDSYGLVDPKDVIQAIKTNTALVSIAHANNETGVFQPINTIYKICKEHSILFHTDASQSYSKSSLQASSADLITLSAHKINGPKGIGALYIRDGVHAQPQLFGGGQEGGRRSGTPNHACAVGFAAAVQTFSIEKIKHLKDLSTYFLESLRCAIPNLVLNGHPTNRLSHIMNLTFPGIDAQAMYKQLDDKDIACSLGSACDSHTLTPSHVLIAMGISPIQIHQSLRFSLGVQNTKEEIDYTIKYITSIYKTLKAL